MIGGPFAQAQCDNQHAGDGERCRRSVVFAVPLVIEPRLLPALLARTHAGWAHQAERIFCPECTVRLVAKACQEAEDRATLAAQEAKR